jgi:LCP family protein required for cell wall assembly
VAIVLFALVSSYLALVIVTRIDNVFFPGRQFTLPGPVGDSVPLPGIDNKGTSGGNDPINILVLGLDRRPVDGDSPTRTDTIFIVRADPTTDSAALLGIPRDLIVDIPFKDGTGTYEDRINTVYVQGEQQEYDGGGIGLLKQVLAAEPFQIEIDKHVIVDFEGFETLIDALGGIDVDVPEEVYDPYYSETELPGDYFPQHFEPGRLTMDGRTALAYSRIRFSSDDLDRIQRQQRVIFAAIDKAKSLDVLKNADELWRNYKDTIQTDIPDALMPGYADVANQVKDNLLAVSLGSVVAPFTTPPGASVLVGDPEGIQELVQAVFSGRVADIPVAAAPTPSPVKVEIQNGAGVEGLARDVMLFLIGKDYPETDINTTNTPDGLVHEMSEIIDFDGSHERNAFLIAQWLRIPVEAVRPATDAERELMSQTNAAIVVVIGTDWDSSVLTDADADATGG